MKINFEELDKKCGRAVEGLTIEKVVKLSGMSFFSTCIGVASYLNTLEYRAWAVDEEGDSLIVTTYHEGYDEYIMAECEAEGWDTIGGYKLYGGWEPVHGLTGQYGYSGAIIHDSESIGAGMVKYMLESEGVFAWAPVAYEIDGEIELEGWCLLEKEM